MSALRQLAAVTRIGLRALPQRLGASLVVVVGMACVVAVTVSILSMSTGFMRTVHNSGRADRVIILSRNSQFEASSTISRDDATAIADAPGVRRAADGKPVVSADALSFTLVTKKSNGLDFYVGIRGVGPQGFALRPEVTLINGRMFRPATHELIVGKAAQSEFEGLDVGSKVSLSEGDWTITGTFDSGGSGTESELLADSETVLSAMRANAFKSMTVMLARPDDFNRFRSALGSNPKLSLDILHESDYLASQSKQLNGFLTVVAYLVGGIMGLGALFGALNTLYAAVSTRAVEIATLRVFGFGAAAIVTSVLAEALVLSLLGAAIGGAVAWLAFNGDLHAAGSLVFRLAVTPALMGEGIGLACALGLLGGLFPALRAARVPIAVALRAS
jgi:putative ABC transport system permease protein